MTDHVQHFGGDHELPSGYMCHYCEKIFHLFDTEIFQCRCGNFVCHNCIVDEGNKYCSDECIEHEE